MKRSISLLMVILLCSPLAWATGAEDDDFDNDSQDDYAVFRPSEGNWYINSSSREETLVYQLGLPGDIPVHGNYDNSSRVALAVYRPSNGFWFYHDIRSNLDLGSLDSQQWGGFPQDIPVPCDFSGDGRMDLTIYRDGNWFVRESPRYEDNDVQTYAWGAPGDIPIPFDVDDDRACDLVTFRDGNWFIRLSSRNFLEGGVISHGQAGDIPFPGKYDDDNVTDFAVFRRAIPPVLGSLGEVLVPGVPAQFIIRESKTQGLTTISFPWGEFGDVPMQKDIDDDGRTDIVVWRPSDGTWYTLLSSTDYSTVEVEQFGLIGDIPLGDRAGIRN